MADTVVPASGRRNRPADAAGAPDLVGEVIGGRYRATQVLARGAMGVVYRAVDIATQREAAVKVLHPALCQDPAWWERFLDEARAASRIDHPSIVRLLESGPVRPGGALFYAMEYLHAEDAGRLLQRVGRLSWRRARGLALQMAQALQAAHGAGIVHRSLKPSNLLITRERGVERVKLLDFGIGRISESSEMDSAVKAHGSAVFGTPAYMAPEQASGERVDPRADVYAVAACLYTFLTGQPPYEGANFMQVLSRVLTQPLVAPSIRAPDNVPAEVEALILVGMAKKPRERYRSMAELAEAILEIDAEAQPQIDDEPAAPPVIVPLGAPDEIQEQPTFQRLRKGPRASELSLSPLDGDVTNQLRSIPEPIDETLDRTQLRRTPLPGKPPREGMLTSAGTNGLHKGSFVGRVEDLVPPAKPNLPIKTGDTVVTAVTGVGDEFSRPETTQVTPLHMLPIGAEVVDPPASTAPDDDREPDPRGRPASSAEPTTRAPRDALEASARALGGTDEEPTSVADILEELSQDQPIRDAAPVRRSGVRTMGWLIALAVIGALVATAAFVEPGFLPAAPELASGPTAQSSPPSAPRAEAGEPTSERPALANPVGSGEPKGDLAASAGPTPESSGAAASPEDDDPEDPDPSPAPPPDEEASAVARAGKPTPAPHRPARGNRKRRPEAAPTPREPATAPEPPTEPESPSEPTPPAEPSTGPESTEPDPAPASLGPEEIARGFRSVTNHVTASCGAHDGATIRVQVVVGSDGRVRSSDVLSAPDEALGRCVAAAVRTARFGRFEQAQDTFAWTYML